LELSTKIFSFDRKTAIKQTSVDCFFHPVVHVKESLSKDVDAGLPDFSLYNIPKREKIPNYHKIFQMTIKCIK
jgi:hypothetical protein